MSDKSAADQQLRCVGCGRIGLWWIVKGEARCSRCGGPK